MAGRVHPYYLGIQRIVAAHPERWSISSLAVDAGLNNATIRRGLSDGSAPSVRTIQALQRVLGLDFDGVIGWNGEPLGDGVKAAELQELARLAGSAGARERRLLLDLARSLARAPSPAADDDGEG